MSGRNLRRFNDIDKSLSARGLVCIACNLLIYQIERTDPIALAARRYLESPPTRAIVGLAEMTVVEGSVQ